MVKTIKIVTLSLLLMFIGCSLNGPDNSKTGGVAPKLLFKNSVSNTTSGVPEELEFLARKVVIIVTPDGSSKLERIVDFVERSATFNNVPAGPVRINVKIVDEYTNILYEGITNSEVIGGETATPDLILAPVIPQKIETNKIILNQVCDFRVKVEWPPVGLANKYDVIVERNNSGTWVQETAHTYPISELRFDTNNNKFFVIDSGFYLADGIEVRYRVIPRFLDFTAPPSDFKYINLIPGKGNCSNITVGYTVSSWVYGYSLTSDNVWVKVFTGTGDPPVAMPVRSPDFVWDLMSQTPATNLFEFNNVPVGHYWVYTYDQPTGLPALWKDAFKRESYTLDIIDQDINNSVLQQHFSENRFSSGFNVTGTLSGSGNNGFYYAEIYFYNHEEALINGGISAHLGTYFAGTDGAFTIKNVPDIIALNNYFSYTPHSSDYLYLYLWCDENRNDEYDNNDLYYNNGSYDLHSLGRISSSVDVGTLHLDQVLHLTKKSSPLLKSMASGDTGD